MTYISTATSKDKKNVYVWERNENGRYLATYDAPYEFFVDDPDARGDYTSLDGSPVRKVQFEDPFEYFKERKRLRENGTTLYESDLSPEIKILSERYYNQPIGSLNITFYDIEVDYDPVKGHAGSNNPYAKISSIALYHKHSDRSIVLAIPPSEGKWKNCKLEDIKHLTEKAEIYLFDNEKDLLAAFLEEIEDTDIISGWNSDFFDDPYIYFRLMKKFGKKATRYMNFPEIDQDVYLKEVEQFGKTEINVKPYGRVWIDYMQMVMKFDANKRDSYSLEMVAEEELDNMEKLDFEKSLYRLYREDFDKFVEYNIRDTEILKGLDNKFKYMNLAINFSHMVTNKIPSVLTTVATSDTAILNYCKYNMDKRVVLPDAPYDVEDNKKKFEGAFVLPPNVGLHEYISSLDIKSLYPSAIRAINISPETLVGQFFENENAYDGIMEKSSDEFTILYENGMDETLTGAEWNEQLDSKKWSISTHGTVFDQAESGIIPSILTNWFEDRVKHQKLKSEAEDKFEKTGDDNYKKEAEYFDNIQYLKKIQLNSLYGVFGNKYFRFHDVRMAESTTKSGRSILMHMAKKIAELLDGKYAFPSESVLYGDTDSVTKDSNIEINGSTKTIEEWFTELTEKHGTYTDGKKEIIKYNNDELKSPCYSPESKKLIEKDILTIYRHRVKKPLYEIELENGKTVTITEDHSLVVERKDEFVTIKPDELEENDIFITIEEY